MVSYAMPNYYFLQKKFSIGPVLGKLSSYRAYSVYAERGFSKSVPKNSHACVPLKVVTNEKRGESRSWQVFKDGTGPWRSMSVYFLMLPSSFLRSISVSCL
jgi:hypothetical protein